MRREGRAPTLVLCSRNTRPEKEEARKLASLCARRGPTVKRWSLDARSGDYASSPLKTG